MSKAIQVTLVAGSVSVIILSGIFVTILVQLQVLH
jgi:hypothetical protein